MDGSTYDLMVMGTGITESMLSGLFSLEKYKILHVDRNGFYGDAGASLNITSLWQKFRPNEKAPEELLPNRDWNIDQIPKFIMAYGKLVKMIIKTKVTHYLNWKSVDASFVYQWNKGGFFSSEGAVIEKVPANDKEALSSGLMSLLEKRRCQKFFKYCQEFKLEDPKTWDKMNPKVSFGQFVVPFSLEENTIDFLGHAVALYTSDAFMQRPAVEVIERIKLYIDSAGRFGDSHFIYPVYGLAGIPESFARKCAVYGGTFMLNVNITKMEFDEAEKLWNVSGVYEGEQVSCKAKNIIANPSYMLSIGQEKLLRKGETITRVICIIDHPIKELKNCHAAQLIIPQKQTKRNSDIYVLLIDSNFGVCKKGTSLAIISANKEHSNVDEDLKVAFGIIGPIKYRFVAEEVVYTPLDRQFKNGLAITDTLDATSHFESAAENVIEIYKAMTGKDLDLVITKEDEAE